MEDKNISEKEKKVLEDLKNAFDSIEAMKETDEHKRISLRINSEIAKEKKNITEIKGDKKCRQ